MTQNGSQSTEPDRTAISALIEALPQPMVVTDEHGGIRHVNECWLTLTGLNRAASAGQHWLDRQAPEDPAAAARA